MPFFFPNPVYNTANFLQEKAADEQETECAECV